MPNKHKQLSIIICTHSSSQSYSNNNGLWYFLHTLISWHRLTFKFGVLTVVTVMSTIFWDGASSSGLESKQARSEKKTASCVSHIFLTQLFYFLLVACLIYSLTLKMEAVSSSATLVNFYWTTWCHIPEYSILQFYIYLTGKYNFL